MNSEKRDNTTPTPTLIELHRKSRILEIGFDDGSHFQLPCEYLRVFSPAAEAKIARTQGHWITGKQNLNVERITPVGNYAVQIVFDDGHDTGVYSWQTLYELGQNLETNWARYRKNLESQTSAATRSESIAPVKILYFATLVDRLGCSMEELELPEGVYDVRYLLAWLRQRGKDWSELLGEDQVTVTVNKRFAGLDTPIGKGNEISITPSSRK
jgi:DUF971 family protein/molybdopterin converting factor small subunit